MLKKIKNRISKRKKFELNLTLGENIREKNFNLVIKMNYSAIEKFLKNEI
jgi:hypothetical protein